VWFRLITIGFDMIVLLTDFGQSEYVGVMKGVIYSIAPTAEIVDLCHDIAPQSIIEASWILKNSYHYFPEGSTFCCVVDPGVGTERKTIAVKTEHFCFVAPDNGLLWETLKSQTITSIRQIPIPPDASQTFHGRDVFAKAAANAELGKFDNLGQEIKEIVKFELYLLEREGIVVRIDRFGNIVTNLPPQDKKKYSVVIGNKKYTMTYYPSYHAAKQDELFLIEGSNRTLEISLRNGNANGRMHTRAGERITIL